MHKNIHIFDIDGTLTPSRKIMTSEFQKFFNDWSNDNDFYLVTGSDLEKVREQVPENILNKAVGIFTCSGNMFYMVKPVIFEQENVKYDNLPVVSSIVYEYLLKYNHEFNAPSDLISFLQNKIETSDYTIKTGNHIEDRGAMVNFSVVGRNCTNEERQEYYEWDTLNGERKEIARTIGFRWPGIDANIGGQISIDIHENGMDKSQVISYVKNPNTESYQNYNKYIFIGDKTLPGGNDYPLANIMNDMDDCNWYQTEGPEHTREILESLND